MNWQPITTPAKGTGKRLNVISIYSSIMGEGPFSGTPAVFIRMAGCNLKCPECDTDYTTGAKSLPIDEIIDRVKKLKASGLIVVTGGEPFIQNLTQLFERLTDLEHYVQVETNGTISPPKCSSYNNQPDDRFGVYIVVSPKTPNVHRDIWLASCAVKYVLSYDSVEDFTGLPLVSLGNIPSENPHPKPCYVARPPKEWDNTFPVYIQPAHGPAHIYNRNLDAAICSCMNHDYRLSLQLNKVLGIN